ncbi:MAG TPA: hypothetical protein VGP02_02000 [Mycobacteriales bacterium]|nr:hypothetical protein [Mycobacteriales bacterium]
MEFSVGFTMTDAVQAAILALPEGLVGHTGAASARPPDTRNTASFAAPKASTTI